LADLSISDFSPDRYSEIPVAQLLGAAARGWIGVDKRLVQAILDHGESAAADVLAFSRSPRDQHRLEVDPLLVDLFRHYKSPEALDYYIDALRRDPEDVNDSLIEALLPFGPQALEPLLKLYEELGEEQGSDLGFVLAGLRIRDPRVLSLLLDRLDFDAADGAFCLGLYGDPAARPALEKMLAEIPEDEVELRREISHAMEMLDAGETYYEQEPFEILEQYPAKDLPDFDLLNEAERGELLASSDPQIRAGAARSFFNTELNPKVRKKLFEIAQSDEDTMARARAWESLADATETREIRDAMVAVLNDTSRPIEERGGAAVGLYAVADAEDAQKGIEALYDQGSPKARAKALEAMWRSLWKPYAKYFAPHLEDSDRQTLRHALRGAGYFRLTSEIDRIEKHFDSDDEDLREDALFAYALAMPGATTRGRVRGMLRKIDSITELSAEEAQVVMFALDERLRMEGLQPVFEGEEESGEDEPEPASLAIAPTPAPTPQAKPGRNDPCPCGSGKKYKKCHGAN
jgi:hypothetical protein